MSDIRPPEIEIELEKEIKIKREIEKVRPEMGHPSHTYGRYQNIFLTDEELADLQASFPAVWEQYIEKLSEYMASTASVIRAMLRPSGAGPVRTLKKLSHPHATGITA